MSRQELLERYFLARTLWWREAMLDMEQEAVLALEAVLFDVRREIGNAINATDWQKDRYAALAEYCDELLLAASDKSVELILEATTGAGIASLENWNMTLSVGKTAIGVSYVSMSRAQIRSWFQDVPLGSHSLSEWVKKAFDSGIREELQASLRKAQVKGLGYGPMVKDLMQTAMETGAKITEREAITLARTYTQTANVEAQKAVYEQNRDVVYGQKWTSVLDNRVCPRCAALDGRVYRTGEQMPPIPLHPRFRCLLLPCTRVDELGVTSEDLEKVARPWVVREPGNIDAGGGRKILAYGQTTEDFGGWYKTLSEEEQRRIVGPVRQKLLKEGKITFGELVDGRAGKLRTLQELGFDERGTQVLGLPPKSESFIEKITGARDGTPESIRKNAMAVNPNFGQGGGYDTNCQRCFAAYELCRRGHNVEAMPNDEKLGSGTSRRPAFAGWECFKDARIEGSLVYDEPIGKEELLRLSGHRI